jgi:hypothetical protein
MGEKDILLKMQKTIFFSQKLKQKTSGAILVPRYVYTVVMFVHNKNNLKIFLNKTQEKLTKRNFCEQPNIL